MTPTTKNLFEQVTSWPQEDQQELAEYARENKARRSCKKFVAHIGDVFLQSGEIAQRHSENKERLPGGPADLTNVITFESRNEPQIV